MRDARRVRTDQALKDAMLALLERKPLEQITIRDIAAAADVHYATFFRHHPTKEALLDHVAKDEIDRLVALSLPVRDAADVRAGFVALFAYVSERRALWTTLLNGGAAGAMREELLRISKKLAAERAPQEALIPGELATVCAVSLIIETVAWWLSQRPKAYSIEQAAQFLQWLVDSPALRSTAEARPPDRFRTN